MVVPTEWVDGMRGALEDEVALRRRPEFAERLPLRDGVRLDSGARAHLYRFAVVGGNGRVPGLLGGELRMREPKRTQPVNVESWPEGGGIRLWSEVDLGPRVEEAELLYCSDQVLRALAARIDEVQTPLEDRIRWLFGAKQGRSLSMRPSGPLPENLNPEQADAVAKALRVPVARIWGPPGTGKTFTAAALAAVWIQAGRRVLLSGPTNRSVDLLLMGVLTTLGWTETEIEGRILRLGTLSRGELKTRWGDIVAVDLLAERRRAVAQADLGVVRRELEELKSELAAPAGGELRSELEKRLQAAITTARELEFQAEVTTKELLGRAQVIATTAHRAALGQVPRMEAMLLDEASMVSTPVALLASLTASQLTLVGDPRQLGPVVQARTRRARRWLGRSLFEDPESTRVASAGVRGPCVMLTTQYRMPPMIGRLVSDLSYGGSLDIRVPTATASGGLAGTASCEPSLSYLNTGDIADFSTGQVHESRLENRAQAHLVMEVLDRTLRDCREVPGGVAVISPYRAHVRALLAAAQERGLRERIQISTVHRFQGRGVPLVVLSFPEARDEPLGYFLRAIRLTDEGGRLVTVAASRASERLIVVGDLHGLARAAPPGGVLDRFLRLLLVLGKPLSVPRGNSHSGPLMRL